MKIALLACLLLTVHTATVNTKEDCKSLLDVIAVVDGSDSLTDDDFTKLKSSLVDLAQWLGLGDGSQRFGVVVFSSSVSAVAPLSTDFNQLRSQITAFKHPADGTKTNFGILEMKKMFENKGRKGVPQVAIVITDGRSKDKNATVSAAEEAKKLGIRMIAVGIGHKLNTEELTGIATSPGDVKRINNFDELRALVPNLVKKFCIVDGGWTTWKETEGGCSTTCGAGVNTFSFSRTCTNPAPKNGGKDCVGSPTKTETRSCKVKECPIDGGWTTWKETEGGCSTTCGAGVNTFSFSRTCTNPAPKNGGKDCVGSPTKTETRSCKVKECPIDGGWTTWKETEGGCSTTCGAGVNTFSFSRTCTNPAPKNGGKDCVGSPTKTETRSCKVKECPIDGGWTTWKETEGGCSTTCGAGVNTFSFSRTCTNPTAKYGGKDCVGSPTKTETRSCKVKECPIDGGWGSYTSKTGNCDVTCGGGSRTVTKTRTCNNPKPQHGGSNCKGSSTTSTTEPCNTQKCPDNPCSGCRYRNGVGYMPFKSDCRFFLQCVNFGASYFVKQCGAGTYWNQEHLTCDYSKASCAGQVLGDVTPEPNDSNNLGGGTCTGRTRNVAGNDNAYEENVPSVGWVKRQCAPGTIYSTKHCICVHGGPVLSSGCKAELYLPFRGNVEDQSDHKHHVTNMGVKVNRASQATFTSNAYLHVNRFSNMDFGTTLFIDFLMSKGPGSRREQAIVSNAECGEAGTIYITMGRDGYVYFKVLNQSGKVHVLRVKYQKPKYNIPRVQLAIHKGKMTARVNGVETSTHFKGRIGKSHCGLQLGAATSYDSYQGIIDDFKLFLCKT